MAKPTEKTPSRIAIVGRNVSAALTCWELSEQLPANAELSWFFTDRDRQWATSAEAAHHWVFHPSAHAGSLSADAGAGRSPALSHALNQVSFFFEGYRRFAVQAGQPLPRGPAPQAILNRIAALALWNDFTPDMWRRARRSFSIPNSRWPLEAPWSTTAWKEWQPVLYHRQRLLNLVADEMAARGTRIGKPGQGVVGIKVGSVRGTHSAVMNVPFAAESFDRMLWMSRGRHLVREHSTTASKAKRPSPPHQELVGQWKGRVTSVALARVAALPLFSVWVDAGERGRLLLRSGRLASGSIKRVFCIPEAAGRARLLVQELDLQAEYEESYPDAGHRRGDAFLWHLCPHLKHEPLQWEPLASTDEELIFLRPDTKIDRFERGIGVAPAKTLLKAASTAKQALEFWNLKKS